MSVGGVNTRLPDFLIIGAQKAGTTWLREMLRQHPGVFMPPHELHFFDNNENYAKGTRWYARHFRDAGPEQIVGEKTPNYLRLPDRDDIPGGAGRVYDLLPHAKLIAILRDPVERAISALNHVIYLGETSPLHSADDLLVGNKRHLVEWAVIESGVYHRQIEAFIELYGRSRMQVLFFRDDVRRAPARAMDRACDFLRLKRHHFDELGTPRNRLRRSKLNLTLRYYLPAVHNLTQRLTWRLPKTHYVKISDGTRRELYRFYAPHNERLFELIGRRPASGWRNTDERSEG